MKQDVVIYASSMINAQGVQLTSDQRAILVAKADRFRKITGTTGKTSISVPVHYVYEPHGVIGNMTYML